jgi:excinuclease Cho
MAERTGAPAFSIRGQPVDTPPQCPGVYRFLSADGRALYIGKSVNLRSRLRAHIADAAHSERQHRLVNGTTQIDCRPTAGEVGALLLENAAIKQEMPLFNRRQRAVRRMWSVTLKTDRTGFVQPQIRSFSLDRPDILAAYGCFASRYHARKAMDSLARRELLCPRSLGLERGNGPCFQYQIGRCGGACAGLEDVAEHNRRFQHALTAQRLSAWPVTEPVLLYESADPGSVQPASEWHLLHNWTYLGTFPTAEAARDADPRLGFMFDRDTYHILRRVLRRDNVPLLRASTLSPVNWPSLAEAS